MKTTLASLEADLTILKENVNKRNEETYNIISTKDKVIDDLSTKIRVTEEKQRNAQETICELALVVEQQAKRIDELRNIVKKNQSDISTLKMTAKNHLETCPSTSTTNKETTLEPS